MYNALSGLLIRRKKQHLTHFCFIPLNHYTSKTSPQSSGKQTQCAAGRLSMLTTSEANWAHPFFMLTAQLTSWYLLGEKRGRALHLYGEGRRATLIYIAVAVCVLFSIETVAASHKKRFCFKSAFTICQRRQVDVSTLLDTVCVCVCMSTEGHEAAGVFTYRSMDKNVCVCKTGC